MKKRNMLLTLLAAALTVSCSNDKLSLQDENLQNVPVGDVPVQFSAYTSRGTSRSGAIGDLTLANLKTGDGFGVFAYYTNADDYVADARPNFMFNQQVKWNTTNSLWDYSPVRYWPNEYGEDAQSEDIDKISFFAYAPYVEVNPSTGYLTNPGDYNTKATWGITGTSRNTYTGDPLVKYVTSFDLDHTVDLCWGVYNEGEGDDATGWAIMNGKQTCTNGLPWLNVQRSGAIEQRLKFTFRHATAKLNVQIDADVDGGENATELGTHYGIDTGEGNPDGKTKIYVRSISFTGIAPQGALNLNNVTADVPLWMSYTGTGWIENGQTVTIYDGLRDGYEGTENAEANSETMTGLNPQIIGSPDNTMPGVTNTPVNLFGRSEGTTELTEEIFVIPTGERVRMTIVYDVETEVSDLPGFLSDGKTHGTSIENRITTDLRYNAGLLKFEGGKSYTLNLHLGMNSVKFDAAVNENWDEGATIDVPRRGKITLSNMTPDDISENRGTEANPRAWVICEEGHVHLCEGGYEVKPGTSDYLIQDPDDPTKSKTSTTKDDAYPLSCHKKKVAVVCYVGKSGSVDKSTTADGSTNYHGLAIAIKDAEYGDDDPYLGCQWDDTNERSCFTDNPSVEPGSAISTKTYLKGIDNTNQLGVPSDGCTGHDHDAAKAVLAYSSATSGDSDPYYYGTPTSTSQWFLPTIGQWALIVQGLTGSATGLVYGNDDAHENVDYQATNINKYITAAGGVPLQEISYWSSVEYGPVAGEYHAWSISFTNGYASPADKTTKNRIRPVIAF